MNDPYVIFWALLLFSSVAWYSFLVFYIGIKAGREIRTLISDLRQLPPDRTP